MLYEEFTKRNLLLNMPTKKILYWCSYSRGSYCL